jgi:hypothetical protein
MEKWWWKTQVGVNQGEVRKKREKRRREEERMKEGRLK